MKHRLDVAIVNNLLKHQSITQKLADKLLALPLITIPPYGSNPRMDEYLRKHEDLMLSDVLSSISYVPFNQGVMYDEEYKFYVYFSLDENGLLESFGISTHDQEFYLMANVEKGTLMKDGVLGYQTWAASDKMDKVVVEATKNNPEKTEKYLQTLGGWAAKMISRLAAFFEFFYGEDYYTVTETVKKSKVLIGKKNQFAAKAGPRVILLRHHQTLPKEIGSSVVVVDAADKEGTEVKAGHVRGYWKTLRADCFRNHPLYGKEKGFRVKPYWRGPKEWVSHGNTYTLVEDRLNRSAVE